MYTVWLATVYHTLLKATKTPIHNSTTFYFECKVVNTGNFLIFYYDSARVQLVTDQLFYDFANLVSNLDITTMKYGAMVTTLCGIYWLLQYTGSYSILAPAVYWLLRYTGSYRLAPRVYTVNILLKVNSSRNLIAQLPEVKIKSSPIVS